MTAISEYLADVRAMRARGNATEHTYRPALKTLLEALVDGVVATNEPRRVACGAPDYLITIGAAPLGSVEAKDVGEPLGRIADSDQLRRYRDSLNNLLLTDYLSFRWYVRGELVHSASLGEVDGLRIVETDSGEGRVEALLRQFLAAEIPVVTAPLDLAERLAGLARFIRATLATALEEDSPDEPFTQQLQGFRRAILPDLTRERFADMYAQTIVYGLFAARCNAPADLPFTRARALFDLPRTNPFLRRLFNYLAGPDLDIRLDWIVDNVAYLLTRTDIENVLIGFGQRTQREDPVFHFYETFLRAYDPDMRELRGVYYTPEPAVRFIVRSLDELLKTRFGLPAGLAHSARIGDAADDDHQVLILDPAVGTGTFLHEIVAVVEEQVKGTLGDAAWGGSNGYVAEHLLPRLFGFELLMAPYTVAHMKIGLQLAQSGYAFESDRRLGVYLTNTLERTVGAGEQYELVTWLRDEAAEASAIKRDRPVMVVVGNPPYSGHSANTGAWITDLLKGIDRTSDPNGVPTQSYFHISGEPVKERNTKWLHDDYVKFIRFAQWRVDRTGTGVLAFITNHGYLSNPTFRGMRRSLMESFDELYLLDLHGNVKKRERSPDGSRDQNVFDIQQGVAIGAFVKNGSRRGQAPLIRHAHLWGDRAIYTENDDGSRSLTGGKYHFLDHNSIASVQWTDVTPQGPFFSFVPRDPIVQAEWLTGWRLPDVMPTNVMGFQTHRDNFAVAFDRQTICDRIATLRRENISDAQVREHFKLKDAKSATGWKVHTARARARADQQWEASVVQCLYRPFDVRWCHLSTYVMDRPRTDIVEHVVGKNNLCLLSARQQGTPGYRHAMVTRLPAESCVVSTRTKEQNYVFPVYRYPTKRILFDEHRVGEDGRVPNFTGAFIDRLSQVWGWRFIVEAVGNLENTFGPEDVAAYIYALLHAPNYRDRYAYELQEDFPRVMVAPMAETARSMIRAGHELIALHLLTVAAPTDCRIVGNARRAVERIDWELIDSVAGRVIINDNVSFAPIPEDVWYFEVGGFQVLLQWLTERQGRELSVDEVATFQRIVGSLHRTLAVQDELEELVDEAGGLPF